MPLLRVVLTLLMRTEVIEVFDPLEIGLFIGDLLCIKGGDDDSMLCMKGYLCGLCEGLLLPFVLRLMGYTLCGIARYCGISVPTVRRRINKVRVGLLCCVL